MNNSMKFDSSLNSVDSKYEICIVQHELEENNSKSMSVS